MPAVEPSVPEQARGLPKAASSSFAPAPVLGVVLAGGASRRMGTPKDRLQFLNISFLELAVRRLQLVCHRVVISRRRKQGDEIAEVIEDIPTLRGPLAGIVTALSCATEEGILCLPVDAPRVPAGFLFELLRRREGADVVVPRLKETYHPTIAFYRVCALPTLRRAAGGGELSPARIVSGNTGLRVEVVGEEVLARYGDPEKLFLNVNSPSDYREALRQAGA